MHTEQHSPSSSTDRTRRCRERKRRGVVCVAPVPIYKADIRALVKRRRLRPEDRNDTSKIASAVEYLVDDWTKGKLTP